MSCSLPIAPRRVHLTRLMSIWRSAGWPCRDAIELDLVAAGWAISVQAPGGHETMRLTPAGIRLLAEARQRNQRSFSAHDQLAGRVAAELLASGRIVWRELSLRARADTSSSMPDAARFADDDLWPDEEKTPQAQTPPGPWRMARPDVFSVRRTSVEDYLQPMVHEVKVSRADLLSDLRHAAKRESYQWLCCQAYYVFPAGVAEPNEIPKPFGVWLLNGPIDSGVLELVRPAQHVHCELAFSIWMALAQATPVGLEGGALQRELGDVLTTSSEVAGGTHDTPLPRTDGS